MARINFIVSSIGAHKFSGGLLCIFEYANGLSELGHHVTIVPVAPSEKPTWFSPKFQFHFPHRDNLASSVFTLGQATFKYAFDRNNVTKANLRKAITQFARQLSWKSNYSMRRAAQLTSLVDDMPTSDISIATSFDTALITSLYGHGRKFYFMQHYEPYFTIDFDTPELARYDAEASYDLPLEKIANSSWLAQEIQKCHPQINNVWVCNNAINHKIFYPDAPLNERVDEFVVVSYGGRDATWKGFKEAAEAVKIARQTVPSLKWRVYGDALLPPENHIANYESLGFITGETLRQAYANAHAILCPSWHESFPLFPLEAMACGTAVITTPYGTEDYAYNERNALVVEARNPKSMADAILRLYNDENLRQSLIRNGLETAPAFTWQASVKRFQEILEVH
jgi:glycosyltransferase involved in cell wall biosynthesis